MATASESSSNGEPENGETPPLGPLARVGRRIWIIAGALAGLVAAAVVAALMPSVLGWLPHDSVAVAIEDDPDRISVQGEVLGADYVIPRSIATVPDAPGGLDTCVGRSAWAAALGGVPVTSAVRVIVEGREDRPVTLTGLRIEPGKIRPPLVGSHVTCAGRGGAFDVRAIRIELRRDGAHWMLIPPPGTPPREFLFKLDKNEQEAFYLFASARECDCEWKAFIQYTTGSKTGEIEVRSARGFFRTTDSGNARAYHWIDSRWVAEPRVSAPVGGPPVKPASPPACRLTTTRRLQRIVGHRVTRVPQPDRFHSGPGGSAVSDCTYFVHLGRGAPFGDANLVIRVTAAASPAAAHTLFAKRQLGPSWVEIADVGDAAAGYFPAASGGRLILIRGRSLVDLELTKPVPGRRTPSILRRVATLTASAIR